jgi:two-component system, sensor histidine kinase and response regulator
VSFVRNLSIKHKFVLLTLLISGAGLALAYCGFMAHQFITFRRSLLGETSTMADIVGYNSSAALTFSDNAEAGRILSSLKTEPRITMACLYGADGSMLTNYTKAVAQPAVPAVRESGAWFTDSYLHVYRPVNFGGEQIGMIYLRADLHSLHERARNYALTALVLIIAILSVSWWLATKFQTVLSGPVFHLVATAKEIAAKDNYALRAQKEGNDELGLLVDEFNRMVEQIQARDAELKRSAADLEKRVDERTADLRKEREFVRNVFDVVPAIIFVKDSDGRFVLVNRAMAELYDVRPEQMIGKRHGEILGTATEGEAYRRADEEVLRTGFDKFIPEETFTNRAGELRWMQTIKRMLRTPDGRKQVLGVAIDITARKKAELEMLRAKEAAEGANRSKSEFLANMSHEIRTPMNGIIGMANLLVDTKLDAEQREFAQTIASSSEALLTILSDILDISKIEAGKLQFERIPFNLRDVVESTADLLAAKAHEKGLQLSCFIREEVASGFEGDPTRLRQVLLNLIGNAVKFTDSGSVHVNVSKVLKGENSQLLSFEIIDTGIGIAPDAQRRLFQAFSQADGSTTRKYGGTGLGLYISKQLIEMMEGDLGVNSAPGLGSRFWFTLELPISNAVPRETPKFPGKRALIVTEHTTQRKVMVHYLKEMGIECSFVTDALKAIGELRVDKEYDLAIVDTNIEGMDGNMVARAVRAEPSFARTRVMMITSLSSETVDELNRSGSIPCLTKPIKRSALWNAVTKLLGEVAPEIKAEPTAKKNLPYTAPSARILVAEDNVVNQRLAMRMLKKLGHHVDVVPDGVKALNAISESHYDLILMDCQMPEMDGYEATRIIRQSGNRIRIIAMTANAMKGDREKCLESGMDDYVSKPIRLEELEATIQRQLIPA